MIVTRYHIFSTLRQMLICLMLVYGFESSGQSKKAFLVGISDYQSYSDNNYWNDIHGANDITLLTPTLKKYGYSITSLCNHRATANEIRQSLKKFSTICKPGDIVYIHFSCHGQPVEDKNGDEDDGWDEAIVPIDAGKVYIKGKYSGENHITDDELNGIFRTIRTKIGKNGYLNVVIDACHAGSSYRGGEDEDSVIIRGTNNGFSERGTKFVPKIDKRSKFKVEKSEKMSDVTLIEACRSYQINSEIKDNGKYYGSLSFYVNKVLQSKNTDWRGRWYEEVINLMSKDMRLIRQNPVVETSE